MSQLQRNRRTLVQRELTGHLIQLAPQLTLCLGENTQMQGHIEPLVFVTP
jgi:hypothetical protein